MMAISVLSSFGPRARRMLRYVGYFLLAIVTFVFGLQLTFPYDRVRDRLIDALASKYDVSIGGVERGIMPGRVYFTSVLLRTHPAKSDEPISTLVISRLEVDVGLLALLRGAASVNIDAAIGPGHVRGNVTLGKTGTEIEMQGVDVPAGSLPMRDVIGLPMSGKIAFAVQLDLPNEKQKSGKTIPNWQKATGAMSFDCAASCTFGDGITKLKPKLKNSRSAAFAGDGIDFGKLTVAAMHARIEIKKGLMEVTKFETKSDDGELHVDFQVTLAPEFSESLVAGCLRFKGSDSLLKREPKTYAALSTTGASLGPDDLFHIRLDGKFKNMKRLAQTCGPTLKTAGVNEFPPETGSNPPKPSITIQPPDPTLTGDPVPAAPPPPIDAAIAPPGPVDERLDSAGSPGSANAGSNWQSGAPPPSSPPAAGEPHEGTANAGEPHEEHEQPQEPAAH